MNIKIRIASWLHGAAEWFYKSPPITKDSVREMACEISPGSIVIFDADEYWKFAFRLFIDRGIFSKKEVDKYSKRAERQRRKRRK